MTRIYTAESTKGFTNGQAYELKEEKNEPNHYIAKDNQGDEVYIWKQSFN